MNSKQISLLAAFAAATSCAARGSVVVAAIDPKAAGAGAPSRDLAGLAGPSLLVQVGCESNPGESAEDQVDPDKQADGPKPGKRPLNHQKNSHQR